MDYVSSSKPQASLFAQIAIPVVIYLNILEIMFSLPYFKNGSALVIAILLCYTWYQMKEVLTWKDVVTFLFLCIIILWSRATQKDGISIVRGFTRFTIGYLIGFTLIHATWSKWPFRLLLMGMAALVLYGVMISGIDLKHTSLYQMNRNYIPMFTFIFTALIALCDSMNGENRPVIWPSLLSLLCAILSQSRAGLLANMLFVIVILCINGKLFFDKFRSKHPISRTTYVILLLVLLILLAGFAFLLLRNSRFATEGIDSSGRYDYAMAFLDELTVKRYITGFRPSILETQDIGTFHNTYIRIITFVGILSIPIFLAMIASLVIFAKRSFLLFSMLGILFVYFLVESMAIFRVGDYIFIPLLMVAWYEKSKPAPLFAKYCAHRGIIQKED